MDLGQVAPPKLRAARMRFPVSLEPKPMQAEPRLDDRVARPPQRLRGPGARQYSPLPPEFSPSFEIDDSPSAVMALARSWFADAPVRPRQRLRGPGARQYSPTHPTFRLFTEFPDSLFRHPPQEKLSTLTPSFTLTGQGPAPPVANARALHPASNVFQAGLRPRAAMGALRASDSSCTPAQPGFRPVSSIAGHAGSPPQPGLAPACEIDEPFPLIDQSDHFIPPIELGVKAPIVFPSAAAGECAPRSKLLASPTADLSALFDGFDGPIQDFQPDFRLAPRIGEFDATVAGAFRAADAIFESFSMADMAASPSTPSPISHFELAAGWVPVLPTNGIHQPPPELRTQRQRQPQPLLRRAPIKSAPQSSAPARFPLRFQIPSPRATPDLDESVGSSDFPLAPAGLAIEPPPLAFGSLILSRSTTVDFQLHPVWLPSLFTLTRPRAGLRIARSFNTHTMEILERYRPEFRPADGPGFSGMLAFPVSAAHCELGDYEFAVEKITRSMPARAQSPAGNKPQRKRAPVWLTASRLWSTAPAFARCMVLAAPLVAPAVFFRPKMNIDLQLPSTNWGAIATAIQDRATIDMRDDFQSGFGGWAGKPGWESTWSVDRAGSAQPGNLALYRPSIPLRDYRLELQGYITSKALGFVFRAIDTDNYHAVKIAVKKPGPLPSVALIRYGVIDGREDSKKEIPIPIYLRDDTLYKVLVSVEGEHFSVSINGQLVDAWSDSRLKSGGVGLFAAKGDGAHVRSVHVVDHEDLLGWLCSQVSQWTADRRTIGVKHE
jgi:hypothetical protein